MTDTKYTPGSEWIFKDVRGNKRHVTAVQFNPKTSRIEILDTKEYSKGRAGFFVNVSEITSVPTVVPTSIVRNKFLNFRKRLAKHYISKKV